MASSVKSEKSLKAKSPVCCQHGGCALFSVFFTEMSLALVPILLVESGIVSYAGFFSPVM